MITQSMKVILLAIWSILLVSPILGCGPGAAPGQAPADSLVNQSPATAPGSQPVDSAGPAAANPEAGPMDTPGTTSGTNAGSDPPTSSGSPGESSGFGGATASGGITTEPEPGRIELTAKDPIPDAGDGAAPAVPVLSTTWSRRAPLVEANSETAIAQLGDKMFVIGGYPFTRDTVVTVQVYDAGTDSWDFVRSLPLPINHGVAASANGKVYVIGGQSSASSSDGYLDTVFEYDADGDRWIPRAQMPTKRSAGAAAVIGDKIYVAGGRPPQGNDFAVYDTTENTWTTLPDLPTQRNHLAAAAIDGKVYVVGGRFGGGWRSDMTNVLEVFDPAANTWDTLAPMPTVRGGINGIAANGCFYVFGGEGLNDRPNGVYEDNEVYNPRTDTWQKLTPIPVPVHGVTGAAFIDGWIHLPGGGTSSGGSSGDTIHQVFQAEMTCE